MAGYWDVTDLAFKKLKGTTPICPIHEKLMYPVDDRNRFCCTKCNFFEPRTLSTDMIRMKEAVRKNIFGRLFWDDLKPAGRAIIKDRNGTVRDFLGCIPVKSFKGAEASVRYEESKVVITIQKK